MRIRSFSRSLVAATLIFTSASFAASAQGPLRVLSSNPRYFTDGSGRAVYLTGSHTWDNLVEIIRLPSSPNPVVDYGEYLSFLEKHRHNCFRLWPWENAFSFDSSGTITYRQEPMPYLRTGPGQALDGRPKFDLNKFNEAYFDRVRERVIQARDREIYVIIMLFQGFSIVAKGHDDPWKGHPLNTANNVNGLDGDPDRDGRGLEIRNLDYPDLTAAQENYVRKLIDTVNDLDNVLYEITNEDNGGPANTRWQYHMIEFISPADWISPNSAGGFQTDPPAADGLKVILNDTDHSFFYTGLQAAGQEGQRAWVWKNFTRGNQPMFMDPYLDPTPWYILTRNQPQDGKPDPYWDMFRTSMGYARLFADRMNLAAMIPQCGLASSGYCLANTSANGSEYLIYLPKGPWVSVDLFPAANFSVEWFNPASGESSAGENVAGGARRELTAPFRGDAVLYLKQAD